MAGAFALPGAGAVCLFITYRLFADHITFVPFTRSSCRPALLRRLRGGVMNKLLLNRCRHHNNLVLAVPAGFDHLADPDFSRETVLFALSVPGKKFVNGADFRHIRYLDGADRLQGGKVIKGVYGFCRIR